MNFFKRTSCFVKIGNSALRHFLFPFRSSTGLFSGTHFPTHSIKRFILQLKGTTILLLAQPLRNMYISDDVTLHRSSVYRSQLDPVMSRRTPNQQLKETKRMHLRTKEVVTSNKICANSGRRRLFDSNRNVLSDSERTSSERTSIYF